MRAALYARYSTENQAKDSIADQLRECADKANREGFQVVAKFTDEAISGGTADRPGYQAMLEAAKRRDFDIIVAEDMKRLWREQAEQWRAIKEWIDNSIAFCTVSGIDSRQANFEIVASVIGAAAEMDRKETAFRTRRGLKGKALAGSPTGGKTYGYTSQNELIESEAAIVSEIFTRYAGGETQRAIARDLNARGVPTPKGRLWYVSAIHAMLHSERYLGRLIYGQSQWIRSARNSKQRRRVEVPREQWVITNREDLRLVSDETWARVRARDTPQTVHYNARPKYPLSGLLLCAECGRAMTLSGGTNSRGYGSQRYVCPNFKEHGSVACSNDMGVSRLVAEELLIEPFRERLLSDQNFLDAVSALKNGKPKMGGLAYEPTGARGHRDFGGQSINGAQSGTSLGDLLAAMGWSPSEPETATPMTDEASILANAERLRAALVSAATDALRDALRRTLGVVRLRPVTDDGPRYLNAMFEGGDMALLEWLAIGDKASKPGLSALVAGASSGRGMRLG